jgi:ubiquinone biosynthesis protein UbiJ
VFASEHNVAPPSESGSAVLDELQDLRFQVESLSKRIQGQSSGE